MWLSALPFLCLIFPDSAKMSGQTFVLKQIISEVEDEFFKDRAVPTDWDQTIALIGAIHQSINDPKRLERLVSGWSKPRALKDAQKSLDTREIGNDQLKVDNMAQALEFYNQAVLWAPMQGLQNYLLPLALANRSLVLMRMKQFHLAVRDMTMAIESGYPKENKYKLFQRMAKCYASMEDAANAMKCHEKLKESLVSESNLPRKAIQDILQESNNLILNVKRTRKAQSFLDLTSNQTIPEEDPLTISKPHKTISRAHGSVRIQYNDVRGRFVEASKDIDVGELIIRDSPVVHYINPVNSTKNCYACGTNANAPVPCQTCANTAFCSVECRTKANATSHGYDCGLALPDIFWKQKATGSGFATLIGMALKVFTQQKAGFFTKNGFKAFNAPDLNADPSSKDPTLKNYDIFFNMASHVDPSNFGETLGVALILWKWLDSQGYFQNILPSDLEPFQDQRRNPKVFFTVLLFHFYSVIQSNNHTVQEIGKIDMTAEKFTVGSAVYPHVASIFNHNCDPNTSPIQVGLDQLTFASRVIHQGEEISHIYQAHFGNTPKAKRQEILQSMFHFVCSCEACTEDYPLAQSLPQSFAELGLDPELDRKYEECNLRIQDALEMPGSALKMLELYSERTRLVCKHLKRPHMFYLSSRAAITDCLWVMFGNKSQGLEGHSLQGIYL